MIYLTGDTHTPIDISKLNTKNFPDQKQMTRSDYVIVLGDFGLLWHWDETFEHYLEWLKAKPYTLLWLDGNHENHEWIQSLPEATWHGGTVHYVAENIIHLARGSIFEIEGKHFLTMGGAQSSDKKHRVEGISWWAGEVPSDVEGFEAMQNIQELHAAGKTVDYVLTHTCPRFLIPIMFAVYDNDDPTTKLLDAIHLEVMDEISGWYFGHWHEDIDLEKYHCLYERVLRLL